MIYVCTHKPLFFALDKKYYTVINVFDLAANNSEFIYQLHPYINEFVMQYYIYQNIDKIKDDYIYVCHYRRIIAQDSIDYNIAKRKVQVYYLLPIDYDKFDKKEICQYEYPLLTYYLLKEGFSFSNKFYNDVIEYLNTQNILNISRIQKVLNTNVNKSIPMRECYGTNKQIFGKIIQFIYNYLMFFIDKYNLCNSENFENFVKSILIKDKTTIPKHDHHRAFGISIEILIGMCILYFKYDYTYLYSINNKYAPITFVPESNKCKINYIKNIHNHVFQ